MPMPATKKPRKSRPEGEPADTLIEQFSLFLRTHGYGGRADIRKLWTVGDCTRFRVNWWKINGDGSESVLDRSAFFKVVRLKTDEIAVSISDPAAEGNYRRME
jgi:hypothetical protein